jgi:truncated hemoglobin YjbI
VATQYSDISVQVSDFPNEQQIKELVDSFYSRGRKDELLGPVFAAAIGEVVVRLILLLH